MKCALAGMVFVAWAAARTPAAHACGEPPCGWPRFAPPSVTSMPANLPGVYWHAGHSPSSPVPDPSKLALVRFNEAYEATPLTFTTTQVSSNGFWIVPAQPWETEHRYRLTDTSACGEQSTTFDVSAISAPLPTQLGTLDVVDLNGAPTFVASTTAPECGKVVWADERIVQLVPAPEALPWLTVLVYDTLVDGEVLHAARTVWPTFNGEECDRIYHLCRTSDDGADPGLAAGPHEIVVRASLPGTTITLLSEPAMVELDCEDEPTAAECHTWPDLCEEDAIIDAPNSGCCSSGSGTGATSLVGVLLFAITSRRRRGRVRTDRRSRNRSRT